jgi:DNA sulfur modification protein DndE
MFSQIRTSSQNRSIVSELTNKFNLGAENIIARIAIACSLQSGKQFSVSEAQDSGGKEYTKTVLFGVYYPIYEAMICTHYQIKNNNKDLSRYLKMHLDHGLELIYQEITDNPNLVGYDYLLNKIKEGVKEIC